MKKCVRMGNNVGLESIVKVKGIVRKHNNQEKKM